MRGKLPGIGLYLVFIFPKLALAATTKMYEVPIFYA